MLIDVCIVVLFGDVKTENNTLNAVHGAQKT